uniref:Uncharacterized mitochondrial protein AtMg00810-like n=1 Tax=Nicotiana tabacum TaxID=4097 RepID=A0A1S4DLQ2_TOBAC|nr:PREDICTED: uncharacterized mitochondrial protein AtMg00810-like [Nicotiana tabacum]
MRESLFDPRIYRRIMGKLNFLWHTRPDIAYSVQHLSQFLQAPQVSHMLAVIYFLRYLMNAPDLAIFLPKSTDLSLLTYSDSDRATYAHTRRFVTRYYITLGGCPISWKNKKQPTISLSSAKAKYRALWKVVAEISWLVQLLADLELVIFSPVPLYYDSQATLHVAKNLVFHGRTKHIEVDCRYVRDSL